jgi:hypothetical protein
MEAGEYKCKYSTITGIIKEQQQLNMEQKNKEIYSA